jgi:hypothetical protein
MATKRTKHEVNHFPPSSAEDKKEWKCTSTPHHIHFHGVVRENFSVLSRLIKLVNSIYPYQRFYTSTFRVKYLVKTGITFLHDNASPNNARLIRVAVQNYGLRGVLPHPSCPPDFIPSDHHVFGGWGAGITRMKWESRKPCVRDCGMLKWES